LEVRVATVLILCSFCLPKISTVVIGLQATDTDWRSGGIEERQPVTAAKFIYTSFIAYSIAWCYSSAEPKLISAQKVEKIFVAPSYCQTAC